jgi:hypothetical protein
VFHALHQVRDELGQRALVHHRSAHALSHLHLRSCPIKEHARQEVSATIPTPTRVCA